MNTDMGPSLVRVDLLLSIETRTTLLQALKTILDKNQERLTQLEEFNQRIFIRSNYMEVLELRAFRRNLSLVVNQLWSTPRDETTRKIRDHGYTKQRLP